MYHSQSADADLRSRKYGKSMNNNNNKPGDDDDTASWSDEVAQVPQIYWCLVSVCVCVYLYENQINASYMQITEWPTV